MTRVPVAPEPAAGPRASRSLRLASLVLADAARVYVRGLPVIVPVAVIVFGAIDVATHALGERLNHPVEAIDTGSIAFAVAIILVLLVTLMFGEVLFAGLLDRVVEADLAGRPSPRIGAVVAGLPYGRLLMADGLVVGLGILGVLLFLLPGLAVFTLLGLAGPLVIIEGLRPWAALRRSFQLLRVRLGAAVLLVLLPGLIVSSVEDWLATLTEHWPPALMVATEVALDATLTAYAGLLLAVLARHVVSMQVSHRAPRQPDR